MITVTKYLGEISAAHHLREYVGNCFQFHGHNYGLEVGVTSDKHNLDPDGLLVDFKKLKGFWTIVRDKFDHAVLLSSKDTNLAQSIAPLFEFSKVAVLDETSVEHFARRILQMLREYLHENLIQQDLIRLREARIHVRLDETRNSSCIVEEDFYVFGPKEDAK